MHAHRSSRSGAPGRSPRSLVSSRLGHLVLAGLLLSAFASCSKSTYLEVKFTGGYTALTSIQLSVVYDKADASYGRTDVFTKDGKEGGLLFSLPSTLVLRFDEFADGSQVSLKATAFDAINAPVATASTTAVIHRNEVTPVEIAFGGGSGTDGGLSDAGTDAGRGGAGGAGGAGGSSGCTVSEVKAGESASFVEMAGPNAGAGPAGDTLWAGASGGSLYTTWLRFPRRGALVAPTGTKLTAVGLAMRVLGQQGMSFGVSVSYSPTDAWSASSPPSAIDYAALMPVSDVFAATPPVGTEVVYPLSVSLKTWTELIASGPISLAVRNSVGATPATSGSLVAYQGGSSGSSATPAPVLRFRFCP